MRIVCISDTHTRHEKIKMPAGDMVIHAGDMSGVGRVWEIRNFLEWFSSLPYKHKILVAGNHDYLFEKSVVMARSLIPTNVTYLQDQMTTVEGLKIYGSPWQPRFLSWAFNVERGLLWKKWEKIPEGLDVLVTHGPPSGDLGGILDSGEEVGDEELYDAIMKKRPRLHVSGHIHCGHGRREKDGIIFVNAAICTEDYQPANPPIVVDL